MSLQGKNVLVTGGTGSFGNRVARFLAGRGAASIVIYSRDENKQYEMQKDCPDYRYIIGDVRDKEGLEHAMRGIDYVFHAAALKQVPACEEYPFEAVKTNILGSYNVCEAAIRAGVKKVIALSTDKAVKPINAMGISKSMMEKIICSQNQQDIATTFCCVRYGNVMGSRGSVIPLFMKQIRDGKKLTLTHPGMTRFLMTLNEAVELVLYALNNGAGGEIFVKKAPAATVLHLARTMIKKYGDGDIGKIEITGIRPGEKLNEVLVNEYEISRSVESETFFDVRPEYREAAVNKSYESGHEYTSANTRQLTTHEEVAAMLDAMGETESYL